MDPENIRIEENIRLETPRSVQVFEIDDPTSRNTSTKCCVILATWFVLIISLIILKTLF